MVTPAFLPISFPVIGQILDDFFLLADAVNVKVLYISLLC